MVTTNRFYCNQRECPVCELYGPPKVFEIPVKDAKGNRGVMRLSWSTLQKIYALTNRTVNTG